MSIPKIVHRQDRDTLTEFLNRDNLISSLEDRKVRSIDYRIMVNGRSHYVRMTVRKSSDGTHFIIGVENIDAEIKREKQQLMERLRNQVLENMQTGNGPILASGIAEYNPDTDSRVSDIFDRADKDMYEDKQRLKGLK